MFLTVISLKEDQRNLLVTTDASRLTPTPTQVSDFLKLKCASYFVTGVLVSERWASIGAPQQKTQRKTESNGSISVVWLHEFLELCKKLSNCVTVVVKVWAEESRVEFRSV